MWTLVSSSHCTYLQAILCPAEVMIPLHLLKNKESLSNTHTHRVSVRPGLYLHLRITTFTKKEEKKRKKLY